MKKTEEIIAEQKAWIAAGNTGCMFATRLVKMADKIGWHFMLPERRTEIAVKLTMPDKFPLECHILSLMFPPDFTAERVRSWALMSGFYEEFNNEFVEIAKNCYMPSGKGTIGLRVKFQQGVSWVQYFGPDAHVPTRRAPYPMLMFTVKLPTHVYAKTMAKGVLHLAHASIEHLSGKICDLLWERSHKRTEKIIGHKPGLLEAAKTTFLK